MASLLCEVSKQNKNKIKLLDAQKRLVGAPRGVGVGEMGEGDQNTNFSFKINKPWGCDVQHSNYS